MAKPPGWESDTPSRAEIQKHFGFASPNAVTEHLSYLVERMGEDHVALGSDFDGAVMPLPIRDASHLQNLIESLRAHGFNDATVRKIAFDNWMRVFHLIWR